jgi:hypothetical protein
MTVELALWLVAGGVGAGLMALLVVLLARGMDARPKAAPGAGTIAADPSPAAPGAHAMKLLFGAAEAEKIAEARKLAKGSRNPRRAVAMSIVAASLTVGGALASLKIFDGDDAPPVASEISAGPLHGAMLMPRKKAPVVLIVPGSGPTDRDGNSPLGVKANTYSLLAEALAKEGIGSVRVDKRGLFSSAGAGDPNSVTVETYAEDYRAWIDTIRAQTGRKCVWLLGHSEGALMVSVAAEGRKDVCGLILVSGMGRKMGDVIREQLRANPANAPLLDQAFAALDDLEAGRHLDTSNMHPALLPLFAPQVQDFLISVFATDPVEAVRRARVNTLIVQGTADLQITLEDARLLDKAPRTQLRTIAGMNHILKDAPGDRAANLATYSNPDLPLAPRIAGVIEDFIEDDD